MGPRGDYLIVWVTISSIIAPTRCRQGAALGGREHTQSQKVPTLSACSELRPSDVNKFKGRLMSQSRWDRLPGERGTELDLGRTADFLKEEGGAEPSLPRVLN